MADFNVPPYFDDYDEAKGYYKILFRPSVAVQTRELNQLQTMVQKQIERFGSHIFKEGSIVVGGGFDVEVDVPYVKATSVSSFARLQEFVGKTVRGGTSGITAYVKAVEFDTANGVYAFMIRYISASTTTTVFLESETVTDVADPSLSFVVNASTATGIGSTFGIQSGVVFSKGYFVAFPTNTIILEKYNSTPTATVGIAASESFVTDLNDSSLLDNSLGSPNENAPGAHRYKINTTLTKLAYKEGYGDPSFIPLIDIKDGVLETKKERPEYFKLLDELAKRTYDESGDYVVRGYGVRTREHLDTGTNEGVYNSNNGGDSTKLSIDVEPGLAYVKGYEVSNLVTRHVVTDKATTFEYVNNQQVNARTGGYFLIKEIVGSLAHDTALIVSLYDTAETRITSNTPNTDSPTGTKIGEARLKALVYESGTLGKPTGYMRAYMFDFVMNAGKVISDVRAIYNGSSPNQFFADVDGAVLLDNNQNVLMFDLGSQHIRSIRSNTGSSDTSFQFNRTETKTANLNDSSTLTTSVTTVGETLAYSSGELSSAEKRELILSINTNSNIRLTGTVTGTNGAFALTGSGTSFNNLSVGDRIAFNSNEYYINSIISSTSLTLKTAITGGSVSANVYDRAIKSGDIIDLTAKGSSGAERTVTVTSGNLVIDLKEVANATPSAVQTRLTYRVNRNTAVEMKKRLRSNRLIKIDTSNNVANSVGPYNLGFSDVYKIRSIRMHTSAFSTGTEGSNVTSSFTLDNGQRDNIYDHARIIHTGALSLTSKHLLVELDHFEKDDTQGFGYFSVDSYPIDDTAVSNTTLFTYEIPLYTSTYGIEYDLRNVFDYRPYKTSTANSTLSIGSATTDPATTSTLNVDGDGLRMVAPDSDINLDYSFYLARNDLVTIDRFGELNVIKGEPSVVPKSPKGNDNVTSLARVYIPPYPSVSETLSRQLNRRDIGCISKKIATSRYTMREIGTLKERVDTLEYYNALNLLEKSVVDLKVLDDSGLNRFKNGFFVDGFLDHSLGQTKNPDYKISVDKSEKVIRPFFDLEAFNYKLETTVSSGIQKSGSLITRPYSNTVLLENRNVTTVRNIEQSVFRFIGTLEISPETDNWCDVTTVDKTIKFGEDLPPKDSIQTEWGSWENNIVGYNVYDRKTGDRSGVPDPKYFIGTFSSLAAAEAAGRSNDPANSGDNRYLIETVYEKTRTGIETSVNVETETENLGNFVTDVSIIPYIRPQVIKLLVRGLKPNTKIYAYFDGEDMSDYVSPIVVPEAGIPSWFLEDLSVSGQTPQQLTTRAEGSVWRVNDVGVAMAYLRLPESGKRFRTGTKEIVITDSPTNAIDATTYASYYFVASGIAVVKQNTIISTRTAVINTDETIQTLPGKTPTEIVGPSCMAYSFKVDVPKGEDGVFLTSVDVWVDQKNTNGLGVWFEIREMNTAGGITRNQVPFSEVWLTTNQVRLWDGTAETEETKNTRVSFPSPVFLQNDTQYAFVIHTEGLNPDYYFWVSRLGEKDIITGNAVTSRQLTGTLFTTNNNLNYDIVPDVDLKIRFNRANFTTGTGTVVLGNKPVEFVNLKAGASDFNKRGETVVSTDILSLSNTTVGANSILLGDKITGASSLITGNVISISGSKYFTDAFGFTDSESYSVANSTGGNKSIPGTITLRQYGIGRIRKYDTSNNFLHIDDSNGLFYSNATIKGLLTSDTGVIDTFDTFDYSTSTFKPYFIKFNKTDISFEKRGWDVSADAYTDYIPGSADAHSDFPTECAILSRRDELTQFGSAENSSTSQVKVTLSTDSNYVSPVFDISRMQCILVYNRLNNDDTGEDQPTGGNLINKYISKIITLADGQDAEDLLVKITAYKPINSNVKVWMKIKNSEDERMFRLNNPWIEMTTTNRATSSSANKKDFKEIDFTVPEAYKNGNGVIQYIENATNITANTTGFNAAANSILITGASSIFTANQEVYYAVPPGGTPITPLTANTYYYVKTVNSTAITLSSTSTSGAHTEIDITDFRTDANAEIHTIGGEVYETYKKYQIKIGLMGTDSSNPPRVGDLRAIALQL